MKSIKKQIHEKRSCGKTSRPYVYSRQMTFLKKVTDLAANDQITDDETTSVESKPGTSHMPKRRKSEEENNKWDATMRKVIDRQVMNDDDNRHLSFFKSLLPSLSTFSDDQTLEFQASVIGLIQKFKKVKSPTQ